MMKCEEVQNLLVEYMDQILDSKLREEMEEHFETCEKCKNEFKEFQIVFNELSETKLEQPDPSLRENFNSMLRTEIEKSKQATNIKTLAMPRQRLLKWSSPLIKIAAGFVLLFTGYLAGVYTSHRAEDASSGQLTELKNDVKEMKEVMLFKMLKEESPSQRIEAVNYVEEIENPDQKIIQALIKTLNTDKNVNVRLAAAYSLEKFSDRKLVIDSLVESLNIQKDPIIQVVLINILTEKKEAKAIKPMQNIISDKNSIKEVKDIAQKSIQILL